MAWFRIPDSDIDPDSALTTGLFTAIRDNIIESAPTSLIMLWPLAVAPSGYLECDGSSLPTTTYAVLFAVLGYAFGGSGASFNIPDLRGEFPRFWDHGVGRDPDRASRTDRGDGTTGDNVGTKQGYQYQSHLHGASGSFNVYTDFGFTGQVGLTTGAIASSVSVGVTVNSNGGNETRGRNVNLMPCIRYSGN